MKVRYSLFLLFYIGLVGCSTSESTDQFDLAMQPKTPLANEGLEEFFFWEFGEHDRLWELEISHAEGLVAFRDSLLLLLGKEEFEQTVNKESTVSLEKGLLANEQDGDQRNALLVHTGSVGHIRPINALEAQILNYQLVKYPMISHPTEFHAFIAFNVTEQAYRVYFGASDQPWPPHPDALLEQLNKDIEKGWLLKYHLHNHYEPESNNYLGILAPSMSDAQYYNMLLEQFEVEKALITNGFHTVEITSKEFSTFDSH